MAFLEKLNKLAKNIEDKTGDAMELSALNGKIVTAEHAFNQDIIKIGQFYYEFFLAGGTVEPNILAVAQSAKAHTEEAAAAKAEIERINAENEAEKAAAKAEREAARAAKAERIARKEAEKAAGIKEEPVIPDEEIVEEQVTETIPEVTEEPVQEIITAQPAENTQSICPSCGATVEPGAKFCGECGHKMEG